MQRGCYNSTTCLRTLHFSPVYSYGITKPAPKLLEAPSVIIQINNPGRLIFQPQIQRTIIYFSPDDFLASSLVKACADVEPPIPIRNAPFPQKFRQHSGRKLLQLDAASFALASIAASVSISNSVKIN